METLLKHILLIICVMTVQVSEALIVIYDSGHTQPLSKYAPNRVEKDKNENVTESTITKRNVQSAYALPITTPSLTPGVVTASPSALRYLQQPLFLVGSDARSKNWLTEMREQLMKLGAIGLLIQAKDKKDVEAMLALAQGLPLVPASAEGFTAELGLTHYPILLSNQGWEQ